MFKFICSRFSLVNIVCIKIYKESEEGKETVTLSVSVNSSFTALNMILDLSFISEYN